MGYPTWEIREGFSDRSLSAFRPGDDVCVRLSAYYPADMRARSPRAREAYTGLGPGSAPMYPGNAFLGTVLGVAGRRVVVRLRATDGFADIVVLAGGSDAAGTLIEG